MQSSFLAATRQPVRTIIFLVFLLLLIIFWPTIAWLGQVVVRSNPVRFRQLEVDLPRRWMVDVQPKRLKAWEPCLTRFCSSPNAEMLIWIAPDGADESIARNSVEKVLRTMGQPDLVSRTIPAIRGTTECFESRAMSPGFTMSGCYNVELGFFATVATAEADPDELSKAYDVVASIRSRN
jgi:hypothetical protein